MGRSIYRETLAPWPNAQPNPARYRRMKFDSPLRRSQDARMQSIPHRFHTFKPPTHGPHFDDPATRWPTFVGEFLAPITRDAAVEAFVFLNHEPKDYEFRFASLDFVRIEKQMRAQQKNLGIEFISEPATDDPSTVATAFGGGRYLADDRMAEIGSVQRRSELVFRFLHSGCALFIDNLVKNGSQWRIEINQGDGQNPLGNTFESMQHLVANFSRAQFDVFVLQHDPKTLKLATAWMLGYLPAAGTPRVRCYL
jgi:hypothetical protein